MELSNRQKEAVVKIVSLEDPRGIMWWKVGEGKTRIALAIHQCLAPNKKLLVVCSPQANRQWLDEVDLLELNIEVEFISHGMLSSTSNNNFLVIQRMIQEINQREDIGLIVLDELWLYKNPRSLRSTAVKQLTKKHPTIGLSGSLVTSRNIEDLYGQATAVGLGTRLGSSLTSFRSQFCVASEDHGLHFYAKKDALTTIQQRLAEVVDIYFPKETARKSRFQTVVVEPTSVQQGHINDLRKDYFTRAKQGNNEIEIEVKNAAVLITKLQQVSDGFILSYEGKAVPIESNKFKRTIQIYSELVDAGERTIIWCAFKKSVDMFLEKLGEKACALSSDHQFDAAGWRNGRYNVCVATVGSGSSLNDFKDLRYSIIYSAPFSASKLYQACGRTERKSSTHTGCHYYIMTTEDSVDGYVYNTSRINGEIEKAMIRSSSDIVREYLKNQVCSYDDDMVIGGLDSYGSVQ